MINLQFDTNNILMRSLYALSGFGNKSYSFDSQREVDELMRKISMDVTYIIRGIGPSRVIFAADSKSWRKSIEIEENEGYKGNRKKSQYVNWDNVYAVLEEFLDLCNSYGFIVTKIDRAEADDILTMWMSELVYTRGEHVISVSGDEDIRQLVSVNGSTYSTVYSPFLQGKNASKKLYGPAGITEWMNTDTGAGDIWNMDGIMDPDKETFKRILAMDKTKFEEVDGRMVRLRKMFCGDAGDNVPAMFTWTTGTGKPARFTESKFEKLMEGMRPYVGDHPDYLQLMQNKKVVGELMEKLTKVRIDFLVSERLNRQAKLVALDPDLFPSEIREDFTAQVADAVARPRADISGVSMYTLLAGTRYVKGDRKRGSEASIFGEMDKMTGSRASGLF